jgi:hypothetical protein
MILKTDKGYFPLHRVLWVALPPGKNQHSARLAAVVMDPHTGEPMNATTDIQTVDELTNDGTICIRNEDPIEVRIVKEDFES